MNRIRRLLAHFALLLLAACGSLPPANLQAPEVGVSDLTLTDIGLDRLRFQVDGDALRFTGTLYVSGLPTVAVAVDP